MITGLYDWLFSVPGATQAPTDDQRYQLLNAVCEKALVVKTKASARRAAADAALAEAEKSEHAATAAHEAAAESLLAAWQQRHDWKNAPAAIVPAKQTATFDPESELEAINNAATRLAAASKKLESATKKE